MNFQNINPIFPFFMILYIKRMVMDMPTNNQEEQNCLIYVFHEELHKLGQYALNQRHFYEWIGNVNTFHLPVPCYSTGIRELRTGKNRIVLVTDGVLECGERRYEKSSNLYEDMNGNKEELTECVRNVLEHVHHQLGRDSATIISWDCENDTYARIRVISRRKLK